MATGRRSLLRFARTAARAWVGKSGSGDVVTRSYSLANFDAVHVSVFDVRISHADAYHVEVRADDNLFELISVRADGDTLRLGLKPGAPLRGRYTLEASVTMPTIREIEMNGAARARLSGFDSLGAIELRLDGASRLRGTIGADKVDATCGGASRVTLAGRSARIQLVGSGASQFDLERLVAQVAEAELSGASRATINATERIEDANLSGASHLRYAGQPVLGDIHTSGASRIQRAG